MARGGYRPGTGRPKGAKDKKPRKVDGKEKKTPKPSEREQIKQILALGHKAKAKMYQEFLLRISKNEKLSIAEKRLMDKIGSELESEMKETEKPDLDKKDIDASEFLRGVWNDEHIEIAIRVRAAEIVFKGADDKKGKKDEKAERAKQVGGGMYASMSNRLKVVK